MASPSARILGQHHPVKATGYQGDPEMNAPIRMLRRREVEQITGLRRSSIYEMMARGSFPKSIKIGDTASVAWLASEIAAWQEALIAERDAA